MQAALSGFHKINTVTMASLLPIGNGTKENEIMKTITAIAFGCMILGATTLNAQIASAGANTGKRAPSTQGRPEAQQPVKIQTPATITQPTTVTQPTGPSRPSTPATTPVKAGKGEGHENNGHHYGQLKEHKGKGHKHVSKDKKKFKAAHAKVKQTTRTDDDKLENSKSGTIKTKGSSTGTTTGGGNTGKK
jgi:hypothetical protein